MAEAVQRKLRAANDGGYWIGRFAAMASPCELLLEVDDRALAGHLLDLVADEAQRIEQKYSRYREGNIVHRINHAGGTPIVVDEETARLLDYAEQLHRLSAGLFDITSGVLRRVWRFDQVAPFLASPAVAACLKQIGWPRVEWNPPQLTLPAGMEIDLGGIGKEYAVDRAAQLLGAESDAAFVVNFGGDLYINKPRRDGTQWAIGLDDPAASGQRSVGTFAIHSGALATSGDARRHLLHQGRRYGHILNPLTGWPVENAPRSITVHAASCMEAGMLATIAMLQGDGAEAFLQAQGLPYRLIR